VRFSVRRRDEGQIAADRPRVYVIHPHGSLTLALVLGFGVHGGANVDACARDDDAPRMVVHAGYFAMPGLRELTLWAGGIDATDDAYRRALRGAGSVAVVAGGTREMLLDAPHYSEHVGFLRLAREACAQVVPVFADGERAIMRPLPWVLPSATARALRALQRYEARRPAGARGRSPMAMLVVAALVLVRLVTSRGPFRGPLVLHVGRPLDAARRDESLQQLRARVYEEMDRLRTE
jgi:hypothetical protein